jgi:SAM-dependent methyltransferase
MAFSYSERFYNEMTDTSTVSAEVIVPLVRSLVSPASVIDVGCGEGKWLAVFKRQGMSVFGIDGDWVKTDRLAIDAAEFAARDLEHPFSIERTADLGMTLEVAEHLPAASADGFVASLVALAPVILFSAAIPFQGGSHHVNEQWPDYWASRFAAHGYVPVDAIRRHIWGDVRVSFFYQQNILLFVKESEIHRYPALVAERENGHGSALSLVHPYLYLQHTERWHAVARVLWKIPVPLVKLGKRILGGIRTTSAH